MTGAEKGFLLLASTLGCPERRPLSVAQLRTLGMRVQQMAQPWEDRELSQADIQALGYGFLEAGRIFALLQEEQLLERYLLRGRRLGCCPVSRLSPQFPQVLWKRLGLECPAVLWARGDLSILEKPLLSLVGSRDIRQENRKFAWEAGCQAARQGYALVSGNARGADRIAQKGCLSQGGQVICVVADALSQQEPRENVLYLSLEDFDAPFSSVRALSRNRVIHALGERVLVAQCTAGKGGTWDGTLKNLKGGWSGVFAFSDGSEDMQQLISMGAQAVTVDQLGDLTKLLPNSISFLDQ